MNLLLLALIPPVGALVVVFWILFWTAFTHLRWTRFYRQAGEEPPALDNQGWPRF